jgi:predicted DNA-binding transcriptional regulator YafY
MQLYLTHELLMMILSYGPSVKVIQPEKLKDQVKELAAQTASLYS